ncbi:MAG TPA: hypothetical protein VIV60_12865 [Polyangiaceae bacterium]
MRFPRFLRKLWPNWIIQEVPAEIYACELCEKVECSSEQLAGCEFRLRCKQALVIETRDTSVEPTDMKSLETDEAPISVPAASVKRLSDRVAADEAARANAPSRRRM